MIKTLQLHNIQRHKDETLHFEKGVNFIIGETDCGKSAVVRAIRWILSNRPVNTTIMRKGSNCSFARITTFDGHVVERKRTKKNNLYILDGQDKKGFGKEVPEEVKAIFPFNDALQVRKQADSFFLVGMSSAPERSREIEKYLELSLISKSISKARSAVLTHTRETEALKGMIKESEDRLDTFKSVNRLERDLFDLGEIERRFKVLVRVTGRLEENAGIILALQSEIKEETVLLSRLSEVADLFAVADALERETEDLKRVAEGEEIDKEEDRLLRLKEEEEELLSLLGDADKLSREVNDLLVDAVSINHLVDTIKDTEDKLAYIDKQLKEIKVCPTCGRKL